MAFASIAEAFDAKAGDIQGYIRRFLVAFIRLNLFVKIGLQQCLDKPFEEPKEPPGNYLHGVLF